MVELNLFLWVGLFGVESFYSPAYSGELELLLELLFELAAEVSLVLNENKPSAYDLISLMIP